MNTRHILSSVRIFLTSLVLLLLFSFTPAAQSAATVHTTSAAYADSQSNILKLPPSPTDLPLSPSSFVTETATTSLPAQYFGVWKGVAANYSVLFGLTGGSVGSIVGTTAYPSLQCGGELTLKTVNANSIELFEDLTYGLSSCIDSGTVTLTPAVNGTLNYAWKDPSSPPSKI